MTERAVELVRSAAEKAIAEKGFFSFAISGGSTPIPMFAELSKTPLPWDKIHIFQVDERFVPDDNPLNNFRAANEALLSKIPIPSSNVHRISTAFSSADEAAQAYSGDLRRFFGASCSFDLIHLGMGDDGHCASLFPYSPLLSSKAPFALAAPAPTSAKPAVSRITLSLEAINAAKGIFFLLQGSGKKTLLESFARNPRSKGTIQQFPASAIAPKNQLTWLLGL